MVCLRKGCEGGGIANALALIFNILILLEYYPEAWLKNRTTLIPKEGKDATKAEKWRSLTISSILARICSSCIKARIETYASLSVRQRGFVEGKGCFINSTLLDESIHRGKRSSLSVAQLDLLKAFDMIPHSAIGETLTYT